VVLPAAAAGAALARSLAVTPVLASTSVDMLGKFHMVAVTDGGIFTDSNGASGTFTSDQTSALATPAVSGPVTTRSPVVREISGPVSAGPRANPDISTIASSLPTPTQAFASAATVAAGVGVSLAAILLITFPSQLFNLTFQENCAEIREWWRRRLRWLRRDASPTCGVAGLSLATP
jgi:hypothetical protein